MTTRTNLALLPALLVAALSLGACSSEDAPASSTSSSARMPDGNIAAGEQQANAKGAATGQSCIDCHGADGNAPIDATYPKIGGQYADYLSYALRAYRDGTREHALMSLQAQDLSNSEIADLSVYFASRDSELATIASMRD